MLYQIKSSDATIQSVAKAFGYDDYKEFFKTMRYVKGSAWLTGSIIEAPAIPRTPRDRPYDGQAHTDAGERGKTFVEGLTMRDIQDCYIRALALSSGEKNNEQYQRALKGELFNIWELDLEGVDPGAIGQNLTCEIERMMGIFPNVPKLEER